MQHTKQAAGAMAEGFHRDESNERGWDLSLKFQLQMLTVVEPTDSLFLDQIFCRRLYVHDFVYFLQFHYK